MDKISLPQFLKLPVFFKVDDTTYVKSVIMINPTSIGCYHPVSMNINNEHKDLTIIWALGVTFNVDINFKDFNEFWAEIDRSFELEEGK